MAETKESGGALEEADRRREIESQDDEMATEKKKKIGESCGPSQLSDSIKESEPKSPLKKVEAVSGEAKPEILTENHFNGLGVLTVEESSGVTESKQDLVAETSQEARTEIEIQKQMGSPLSVTPISRHLPQAINDASISSISKTPTSDGYNWRKYGQKQVKTPKGSRSYYRCTSSDCSAKKIECSNDLGYVVEVVNKGSHSHDPPRKNNYVRESRLVSSSPSVSTESTREEPIRVLRDSDQSTSAKEPIHEPAIVLERKRHDLSGYDENHQGEPEPKRRYKKDNSTCPDSISKTGKQRFVVHAAGDVGISGDGYRWRKYGQKMVKGNPNPRNYYRCTSAGCSARKHIERAVDNPTAVLITYKDGHDHDMPVPKKRHGPPSALLIAAAASSSKNNTQTKDICRIQVEPRNTTNQQSAGTEGESAGEKVLESARTLLGIGFEIKQC